MVSRSGFSRLALFALLLLAGLVASANFGGFAQNAETDRGVVADLISRALSSDSSQVAIGAVEGALSSDVTIRDIVLSDRDGPWLRLDRARLIWTRTALLRRRLEVNRLEIGRLEILRRPAPQQATVAAGAQPILPELPLKVIIEAFQLSELVLGAPVLGDPARLTANGAATLGPPAEGLDLRLEARRLDRAGSATIRLGFVPQSTQLQLMARIDEPAGGLIAKLASLPGEPPVQLDVNGTGPLDSFRAELNFTAGETIGARGTATLGRAGAGRDLALALDARIEGLMPAPIAPVFAGSTRLDGAIGFADDGAIAIRRLAMVSALARLDVGGRYTADKMLDLRITAAALPNAGSKTVASGTEIGKLAFDATIQGPVAGPRIVASLDLEDGRLPLGALGKLTASFTATPTGTIGEPGTRIALVADGEASGVALTDRSLARLVGERVVFTMRGTANDDATADFETLRLAMSGVALDYRGKLGQARIAGQLKALLPDLSRLSGLAGRPLGGTADVTAEIDATPRSDTYAATLSGRADRLSTGQAEIDRLLAGELTLAGRIGAAAGDVTVSGLRVAGRHAAFTADGALRVERSDLRLQLSLPDLKRADPRLSGRGEVNAVITGPQDRLNAQAKLAISNATALGRPIPRLAIDATIRDLQGALQTDATLDGEIEGKPARGRVQLARLPGDGWDLSTLDLTIGSVRLNGAVSLDAAGLAAGTLALAARNLDDLSPLALTRLGGQLDAEVKLARPEGRQDATVTATGARLSGPSVRIDRLDTRLAAQDLYRRPVVDGTLTIDRALIAGEAVSAIRFASRGNAAASEFTLSAAARGFALNGAGRLVPAEPVRLELTAFEARRDARRIALDGPATLSFPSDGVSISGLALAIERGRVTLDGLVGDRLDLRFAARDVPLSAARIFAPSLDLAGTLNAQATIGGTVAAPTGEWTLRLAGVASRETRNAGLPPIAVSGDGRLSGERTSVDLSLNAGSRANLTLRGSAPLQANGALDLAIQGRLDAAIANTMIAARGQRLTGSVAIDLRATGEVAAPRLSGGATLANGSFTDALQGIRLTGIEARLAANGDNLSIERASARTANGGTLSASGQIRVDPAAGFPGQLRINGSRAQLVANGIVTAVADLALELSGPLARNPTIGGRIDVVSLDVAVPDRLPGSLEPVQGIRHVRPTRTAAARLADKRKTSTAGATRGRAPPPFNATLALAISAPNRVFIRGRGIDAELGGQLRVGGTLASPAVDGAFELRRGRLSVATQRLDFTRGRITFTGAVIPELDFVAQTRAGDVTAQILVTGPADQPGFAFTSQPDLPQDEVLSRILFSRASGSLSPFQALQLAQAAAQFSGAGGDDSFERLRRSLGVDNLDIQFGEGGPTVGVSRYIGNNVTLGVKAGARPEDSGVSVGIDLTRRLKLQAETGVDGSAAVGLGAEWEY